MNRMIELYMGFPDYSWNTDTRYVPANLPRRTAVALATQCLEGELAEQGIEIAFIGLYSYEEDPAEA